MPIESGGSGGGGMIALFDSGTLGADAASIDTGANGIASGHGTLLIFGYLRCTDAVGNQNVQVRFNGDTGANYSNNRIQNANTTLAGSTNVASTSLQAGNVPGNTATASYFGFLWGTVPLYDLTANFKAALFDTSSPDSNATNNVHTRIAGAWASASAITQMSIFSQSGGNIKAGSRLVIYGTK